MLPMWNSLQPLSDPYHSVPMSTCWVAFTLYVKSTQTNSKHPQTQTPTHTHTSCMQTLIHQRTHCSELCPYLDRCRTVHCPDLVLCDLCNKHHKISLGLVCTILQGVDTNWPGLLLLLPFSSLTMLAGQPQPAYFKMSSTLNCWDKNAQNFFVGERFSLEYNKSMCRISANMPFESKEHSHWMLDTGKNRWKSQSCLPSM